MNRNTFWGLGSVENLSTPPGSLDAAYARWLFCWLPDPGAGMSQVARALKPGGALVIQDHLDWGGMKLMPTSDIFDRTVLACMKSWAERSRDKTSYCYAPVMVDVVLRKS